MSDKIVMSIENNKLVTRPHLDPVKFDLDEFEIVELENREEFIPWDGGGGGGGGGCAWKWGGKCY